MDCGGGECADCRVEVERQEGLRLGREAGGTSARWLRRAMYAGAGAALFGAGLLVGYGLAVVAEWVVEKCKRSWQRLS